MVRTNLSVRVRLAALFLAALCLGLPGCAARPASNFAGGVVAADHPLASEAGASMLRLGGNAVDAAVATSLALSVVRPDSCGIGGGGFMLIHLENDPRHGTKDIALNYRETCPAGIGPDTYENWNDPLASRDGGRAVGIPGTVAGLLHALENYGTLDRAVVFAPAVKLAESGWRADDHHVRTSAGVSSLFDEHAGYAERFGFVWEESTHQGEIREGDLLRNPGQARALRLIAEEGRSAFYEGAIADAIVDAVRRDGGVLTRKDLAGYAVSETQPIRVGLGESFDNRTMLVMPPPSSGGIAIAQMFGLLDRLATSDGFTMPANGLPDAASSHLLIESMKHAFADRSRHLADPAFVELPIAAMLDPGNLDRAAAMIDPSRTMPSDSYGVAPGAGSGTLPEDHGTSHFSVVDGLGNAVACTETINLAFGSKLSVDSFGFSLNNQMDDFTTVRGKANAFGLAQSDDNLPEPGKRPLSSMSPTIVLDPAGEVFAVAGASGGPRIINATAQVLLRALLADASADQAVSAPRLHHQWSPDAVYFETARFEDTTGSLDTDVFVLNASLARLGHAIRERRDIGSCQLIRRRVGGEPGGSERYEAGCDPRKGGRPAYASDPAKK